MNKIFGIILVVIAIIMFCLGEYLVVSNGKYKVYFTNTDNDFTIEVPKESYVKKPRNPERDGYIFLGWYYNDIQFDFNSKIIKDVKLVAKWSKSKEESNSTLSSSLWELFKNRYFQKMN